MADTDLDVTEPRPADAVPVVEPGEIPAESVDTSPLGDPFAGYGPLTDLPELGRAITPAIDVYGEAVPQLSGSPANYEELRGCPHPGGWSVLRAEREAAVPLPPDALDALVTPLRAALEAGRGD